MEVDHDLYEARKEAMWVNHNMQSLKTVIGKHAVNLVDLSKASTENRNPIVLELENLTDKWSNILLRGQSVQTNSSGMERDVDYEFRKLVEEKIKEFTEKAIDWVSNPNNNPVNMDQFDSVRIYSRVSQRAGRNYEKTVQHLQQYAAYLSRLGHLANSPESEDFKHVATACIWSGLRLGTYLDMIL